tara:strand:- start:296 stop:460 length:165 start_codon:yes stop_codon:yes gene_type:complete
MINFPEVLSLIGLSRQETPHHGQQLPGPRKRKGRPEGRPEKHPQNRRNPAGARR